jgi:predicted DNA-binding protein
MSRLLSISVPIDKKLRHYLKSSAEQEGRTLAAYVRTILIRHMRREDTHDGRPSP